MVLPSLLLLPLLLLGTPARGEVPSEVPSGGDRSEGGGQTTRTTPDPAPPSPPTDPEPAVPGPTRLAGQTDLARIVSELAREAADFATEQHWPRTRPDFIARRPLEFDQAVLLDALCRKQHGHPAIDAYIRWNLLGYARGILDADRARHEKLVAAMPALLPTPDLPDELRKLFEAHKAPKGRKDPRVAQRAAEVWDQLKEARARTELANMPVVEYRSMLIGQLPPGEVRLIARLADLRDRIQAGTFDARRDPVGFARDVELALKLDTFSPQQRARVAALARQFAQVERGIIGSLGRDNQSEGHVTFGTTKLSLAKLKSFANAISQLEGQPAQEEPAKQN